MNHSRTGYFLFGEYGQVNIRHPGNLFSKKIYCEGLYNITGGQIFIKISWFKDDVCLL